MKEDAEGEMQLRDLSLGAAIQYVKTKDEAVGQRVQGRQSVPGDPVSRAIGRRRLLADGRPHE